MKAPRRGHKSRFGPYGASDKAVGLMADLLEARAALSRAYATGDEAIINEAAARAAEIRLELMRTS